MFAVRHAVERCLLPLFALLGRIREVCLLELDMDQNQRIVLTSSREIYAVLNQGDGPLQG